MIKLTDYSDAPYIAMCQNYYGRGFTVEEAKQHMVSQGGNLESYFVKRLPEGATEVMVDFMGQIHWTWAEGADRDALPEMVEDHV